MTWDPEQKAALEPALKGFLGDDAAVAVITQLDGGQDLRTALKSAAGAPPEGDKVRLISDLAKMADYHIPLLVALLKASPVSLQDVARHHYDSESVLAAAEPSALASYQTRLFSAEPTAVLLGLVSRGVIQTGDVALQELVEKILSESLLNHYRIDKVSVKKLFKESNSLKDADAGLRTSAEFFLKTLQRLQALVRLPQHIAALIDASFDSARSIVDCSVDDFVAEMESRGLEAVAARRIYDQATTVELRNEQAWALGLQQRNRWALPRVVAKTVQVTSDPDNAPSDRVINLTNLFRDMDTVACEECASVLSPAAYFVDLLRLLQTTSSTGDRKSGETLLTLLLQRRPDLANLQLSCTNTKVTLPYLDLVNEVLEARIDALNGNTEAETVPQNMSADESNDHKQPQPRSLNALVYKNVLAKVDAPMGVFPYDYSVDAIRSLLAAGGTTRYDVLKTFQSPQRVLGQYTHLQDTLGKDPDRARKLTALTQTLLARALAAEALNLQERDFKAICGEAFYPVDLWLACQTTPVVDVDAEYKSAMDIPSVAQLWGYDTTEDMLDEKQTRGLTFINAKLLPRAGITFQQLHKLLQTQYMGRRLVVTSAGKDGDFSKKLDDMRLRLTLLADLDAGTLTEEVCRDLQSFIRLWKKIGWPIPVLDSVLSTLRRDKEDGSTAKRPDCGITAELIQELAAVKNISDMTGLSPAELQPLWGTIDTNGPESLYSQLFLKKRLLALDPVFRRDDKTEVVLAGSDSIEKHKAATLTALQIPEQQFLTTLSCVDLSVESDLSVSNVSKIHRISLMCRLFGIKPDQYPSLCALLPGVDLLASPTDTLDNLTKIRTLVDRGWTATDLTRVVGGGLSEKETQAARKAAARLQAGVVALDATYPTTPNNSILAPPDAVTQALTLLFPPAISPAIHALIEGSLKSTAVAEVKASTKVQIPAALATRLSSIAVLNAPESVPEKTTTALTGQPAPVEGVAPNPDPLKQLRLTLTGTLTAKEKALAVSLVPNDKAWESAVELLWDQSRQPLEILVGRVSGGDHATSKKTEIPADTEEVFAGALDTSTNERRLWFLQQTAPLLKTQLRQQLVVESVASDFGVDNAMLIQLLTRVVRLKDDQNAFDAMKSVRTTSLASTSFSGLFLPPLSETYRFVVSAKDKPEASINGRTLEFSETARAQWESDRIALTIGKSYTLVTKNFPFMSAGFVTGEALLPSGFTADLLLDHTTDQAVRDMYAQLGAACKIIQVIGLDADAVSLFSRDTTDNRLRNITIDGLLHLQTYQYIQERTALSGNKRQGKFSDFFEWVCKPAADDDAEIYDKLSAATSWSPGQLRAILTSKYPSSSAKDIRACFQGQKALAELADIYGLLQALKHLVLEPELLFRIATPEPVDEANRGNEAGFANLQALELSIKPSADGKQSPVAGLQKAYDGLRDRRRKAMVQYLLNRSEYKKKGILDADHLFEHLLIDVQMGPQLETSRIKQAISTVQLFVQRCNLGHEKTGDGNKNCAGVSAVRWAYMAKYTLWEANRKLFLYPENWVDPAIRDNKTELFRAFESSIMQSNLDMQKIQDALAAYVYGFNEVATLDVRAYYHEKLDDDHSRYHFFGRTRQAPFNYFYRRLERKAGGSTWSAWSKIEVDIPSLETDADGKSLAVPGCYLVPVVVTGRLFLFLPQFLLQTKEPLGDKGGFKASAGSTVSVDTPKKYWEVKMGWTEYRNGRWSAKAVSQSSLEVPGAGNSQTPPPLSSFQFFVDILSSDAAHGDENDVVQIDVNCWGTQWQHEWKFDLAAYTQHRFIAGRFKIRNTQVTVSSVPAGYDPDTASKPGIAEMVDETYTDRQELAQPKVPEQTIATHFSKFLAAATEKNIPDAKPQIRHRQPMRDVQLLDPKVEDSLVRRTFTWTMSYQDIRQANPSAQVVEVASHVKRATYFVCPTKLEDGKDGFMSVRFDSSLASSLMQRSISGDVAQKVYSYLSNSILEGDRKDVFGGLDKGYYEHVTPYALYSWEIGMHAVSLLMERLLSTQQFELALSVARLVFDPSVEGDALGRCWRFLPFLDVHNQARESVADMLDALGAENEETPGATPRLPTRAENAITQWKDSPFTPHAIARDRPIVYMKRIVMKYIEILIASGDEYFRQSSLEAIPLAIQRYVEASHLFGPPPQEIPQLGKMKPKTFSDLVKHMDVFSNAQLDMELEFPYSSEPCYRGSQDPSGGVAAPGGGPTPFTGMIRCGYFAVPANAELVRLRSLIDDRFYKIRNALDIQGRPMALPLFDAPLDPGLLAQAQAAGLPPSAILNDLDAPMPNYRFRYLLQKAFEICAELKSLGEQFLGAKEKRDAEGLTALLARQDLLLNTNLLPIKELQRAEVEKGIASLEEIRKSHVGRLRYYLQLIGEPLEKIPSAAGAGGGEWTDIVQTIEKPTSDELRMSPSEALEADKADSAAVLTDLASVLELTSAGLAALPNVMTAAQPMGVGAQFKFDADNVAASLKGMATVMQLKAQMDSHESQRAARKSQMTRQLQERRLQANLAARDVTHTDRDIAVQRVRLAVCDKEIDAQRHQIERSAQVQEWHRAKYTNESLYAWLENSFRRAFYETYLLAMQLARRAEKAFLFETGTRTGNPLPASYLAQGGYWDTARDGLLSAHNLFLGLKRLELASMERRPHDYELVKNVSLRQVDPLALLRLRRTGSTTFSLGEVLFDMDFPGHYFRRIKTLAASVYCIVGRYAGVNCELSLVDSRIRVSPSTSGGGGEYACQGRDDPRFRVDRVPITSVAMTTGQNDSGVFELSLAGEQYLPFEGAGAAGSTWKMEFPSEIRQFDWNSISDVVLHVQYTAIDGGAALRKAANTSVKDYLKSVEAAAATDGNNGGAGGGGGGAYALLELRNDFANEWRQMLVSGSGKIAFGGIRDRLPFWTRGSAVTIGRVALVGPAKTKEKPDSWVTGVRLRAGGADVPMEESQELDFGGRTAVLLSKSALAVSAESTWELEVDPKVVNEEFFRGGNDIQILVKYVTQFA